MPAYDRAPVQDGEAGGEGERVLQPRMRKRRPAADERNGRIVAAKCRAVPSVPYGQARCRGGIPLTLMGRG